MQIVIDIDEDTYKYIISRFKYQNKDDYGISEYEKAGIAIKNGKPLPEGHGALIDADYLREDFKASRKISFAERMDISCIVDHAPTIIGADKEESEG
jgi:hypothetical protein